MHTRAGDAATTHHPGCDTGHHTDPASGCATHVVDTCGVLTHIAYDDDGAPYGAVIDARTMLPRVLTAAACMELADRFTQLARLLH